MLAGESTDLFREILLGKGIPVTVRYEGQEQLVQTTESLKTWALVAGGAVLATWLFLGTRRKR
jgi:hypothetical protein